MIVLTETTDALQVVLGGSVTTNQLPCLSTWRDITTTAYTPGRTLANTNNTSDVSIVTAPAASTQRVVDQVNIYNRDTASAVVTVKFDANGTEYVLWTGTLAAGERVAYSDATGWTAYTTAGAVKTTESTGLPLSSTESEVVLSGDVTNNNAVANTLADVTGLSFAVTAGSKYWFRSVIPYTSAATTTGSRWTINGPAATMLNYSSAYTLTATSQTVNFATAYQIPAASNATSLTAGNVAVLEGIVVPSSSGTVVVQFASEVSSSAVVAKAGGFVRWKQVA